MKVLLIKITSLVSIVAGFGIAIFTIYPLVSYELTQRSQFPTFLSPVPEEDLSQDFTKASTWFLGGANQESFESSGVSFYTISIPELKIENAAVALGGEDLSLSLIQYPGTSLPGKRGNAVVFGHSVLPQFFNAKDYMTIFSTLPTIKKGNEVFINYDGIVYKYIVNEMFEVQPTDLQILEQNTDDSFITLVTCVPPGHPLRPKRLIVRAKIAPYEFSKAYEPSRS